MHDSQQIGICTRRLRVHGRQVIPANQIVGAPEDRVKEMLARASRVRESQQRLGLLKANSQDKPGTETKSILDKGGTNGGKSGKVRRHQ